jgi:hypothetical protein
MSKHRNAEFLSLLKAVTEGEFEKRKISLINYQDIINYYSLDKMKSPSETGY